VKRGGEDVAADDCCADAQKETIMPSDAEFSERLIALVEEARAGDVDRREFLRRAALLGLSAAVADTVLGVVFPREAVAAAPMQAPPRQTAPSPAGPSQQGRMAGGHYQWGTVQPAEGGPGVFFWLRSPHEGSPKILTRGWPMTAHVRVELPGVNGDFGSSIRWEGSGAFYQTRPRIWTPSFSRPGQNFVRLSLQIRERVYSSTFWFQAKDANLYARLGSMAQCHADAHGCPACPHPVRGPLIDGVPDVQIDGKPVARVGHTGVHAACCGPNLYSVAAGDPEILIDGRQAARLGDPTRHCGGVGQLFSL
jgi:uncharacterized Zn-binding protein involved in type VI secretion